MNINPNTKLVMIGDSITDCGRFDTRDGLGNGYVRFADKALREEKIQVVNAGISGNTVRDLKKRWRRDVLDFNPDWLSMMIGINDVWRQFDSLDAPQDWVLIEEYEQTLDALVAEVLPSLQGLVLMTPYYLQLDRADPMRAKMDEYGQVVRKLAEKYQCLFVDTQAAYDTFLQSTDASEISNDRIHMNAEGHRVLADAFLKAVGSSKL
jgi:lysophospholipase L1-like esterase